MSSAGAEAVALAEAAGLRLDPWQQDVLHGALGERRGGTWTASEVGLVVPRQNGKGAILEARELAGLFLFGEQLIIHSAHLFDTALEAFRRIESLISENPEFKKKVKRTVWSHGEEGIELKTGQRLRFKTRTKGGGRGLSGDTVILDEAYNLPGAAMAALLPTLSARPNPQVWYTSSAPLDDENSDTLRSLCKRGRAADESAALAYFEWCGEQDAASDDRQAWADANPGLGIRLTAAFTATELAGLPDEAFRRERLGIWYEDGTPSVIDHAAWTRSLDPTSRIACRYGWMVDVTPDRSRTAIAVAGERADGHTHIEVVQTGSGMAWAPERLRELSTKWGGEIALDPSSPAGSLIPGLSELGLEPRLLSAREMAQACGWLVNAITEDRVRHLGQPELDDATAGARKRDIGDGAWKWSRKDSTIDIAPLVAVTGAAWIVAGAPPEYDVLDSAW